MKMQKNEIQILAEHLIPCYRCASYYSRFIALRSAHDIVKGKKKMPYWVSEERKSTYCFRH